MLHNYMLAQVKFSRVPPKGASKSYMILWPMLKDRGRMNGLKFKLSCTLRPTSVLSHNSPHLKKYVVIASCIYVCQMVPLMTEWTAHPSSVALT